MHQGVLRRRRPWTVVVAVVTAFVHLLLAGFGALVASSLLGNVFVSLAALFVAVAAFWMFVSSLLFKAGEVGTRRNGLVGTATALGLELLCLGALWYGTLSADCPPEGCTPSNEEWALVELVFFSPLLFLGSVTFLLLCTPSATAYFRQR
ncbi:hypothetical protein ABGB12_31305 [Actinocorallia sp. B10E7]|uniref:hypothetical protein n=1 Tax=Actinocorallia sp. B10E7 TaxID=3153558 RepID=UPI00325E8622